MLALAIVLVAVAGLQLPVAEAQQPCCAPYQWQGIVSQHFSPNSIFREGYSQLSYDYQSQLVASNETLIGNSSFSRQQILFNGRSQTAYIVEHRSRECKIISVGKGLDKPCIPSFFRSEGTYHFGAASEILNYGAFRGSINRLEYIITATSRLCIPISQMAFSDRFREIQSFVNITPGIKDRRVFNVPAECRRAGLTAQTASVQQLLKMAPSLSSKFIGLL